MTRQLELCKQEGQRFARALLNAGYAHSEVTEFIWRTWTGDGEYGSSRDVIDGASARQAVRGYHTMPSSQAWLIGAFDELDAQRPMMVQRVDQVMADRDPSEDDGEEGIDLSEANDEFIGECITACFKERA